ncbi:CoA transferase [Nocardia sp. NPDC005978]|uniref:CoA transferase n=1 Tax=Nocardia sp. NPDC005978 TaxID=3156725 RepID=UPI0033B6856F
MALTGRAGGPPLAAPGDPAARVARELARTGHLTRERTGVWPELPGVELLGERAALAGLGRRGPESCGGAFRVLGTADGHVGLSLPRAEDVELLPALVEGPLHQGDTWGSVARWARRTSTVDAAARVRLLGLAGAAVPTPERHSRPGISFTEYGRRTHRRTHPVVVDLTALWAGPLCAHLLGLGGARIIKIESRTRPDGSRRGAAGFFDLLHHGHTMVGLDFRESRDLDLLHGLITDADLVLESSRPRALRQLGIDAAECAARGTSWLSITAHGRASDAIGFGDDVAAAAGLVIRDRDAVLPCGDAIADPLTGVCAAAAASAALLADNARLIDVSMLHLAAETATGAVEEHSIRRTGQGWWVDSAAGSYPVAAPRARRAPAPAGPLGADNAGFGLEVIER